MSLYSVRDECCTSCVHNEVGNLISIEIPARHSRNQMPVGGKIFVILSKTSRVRD